MSAQYEGPLALAAVAGGGAAASQWVTGWIGNSQQLGATSRDILFASLCASSGIAALKAEKWATEKSAIVSASDDKWELDAEQVSVGMTNALVGLIAAKVLLRSGYGQSARLAALAGVCGLSAVGVKSLISK